MLFLQNCDIYLVFIQNCDIDLVFSAKLWYLPSISAKLWYLPSIYAELWYLSSINAEFWYLPNIYAELWYLPSIFPSLVLFQVWRAASFEEYMCSILSMMMSDVAMFVWVSGCGSALYKWCIIEAVIAIYRYKIIVID